MDAMTPRDGSIGQLVDELARWRAPRPGIPIGLLFELIAADRPPVRVIDGVGGDPLPAVSTPG